MPIMVQHCYMRSRSSLFIHSRRSDDIVVCIMGFVCAALCMSRLCNQDTRGSLNFRPIESPFDRFMFIVNFGDGVLCRMHVSSVRTEGPWSSMGRTDIRC